MSYERHKVCMECKEIKPITAFPYGFGSYRKSDRCRECKGEAESKWLFGGSLRVINKKDRVCRSTTFFDKRPENLSKLKSKAERISDRESVETNTD